MLKPSYRSKKAILISAVICVAFLIASVAFLVFQLAGSYSDFAALICGMAAGGAALIHFAEIHLLPRPDQDEMEV